MKKFLKTKFGRVVAGVIFLVLAALSLALLLATVIDLQVMGNNRFAYLGTAFRFALLLFSWLWSYCFITLYFVRFGMVAWGLWPFIPALKEALGITGDVESSEKALLTDDVGGVLKIYN